MTTRRFAIAAVLMAVSMVAIPHVPAQPEPAQVDPCAVDAACNPWLVDMPPCVTEDSLGPCYWDATVRGNRQGASFYVDANQNVHYLH